MNKESVTKKSTKRTAKGYVIGRAGFAKISAVEGIFIESDEASIPSRPTTPKIDKGNT